MGLISFGRRGLGELKPHCKQVRFFQTKRFHGPPGCACLVVACCPVTSQGPS